MSCLLAIDCSTERLALALSSAGRLWRVDEAGGALASARLLPAVQAMFSDAGLGPSALDAVAFGQGPGAFTGLRTACAVAQGLALGWGRPVLAIDSLAIVAEDTRGQHPETDAVWVAMDARMDEAYAAHYRWDAGDWALLRAPGLWPVAALAGCWRAEPPACVAGSALAAFGERLASAAALRVPQAADRAGALARLAQRAWDAGRAIDPALALPLYLRDKVAFTTAERELERRPA
jgi:tRNA threonylcarbamoyladenosine biosynthesis protein TsaB